MQVRDQPAALDPVRPVCCETALEQIRKSVSNGYLALGHGGLEVGGVLLGRVAAEGLRIEASQPLISEHAFGPSLRLSNADEEALSRSIVQASSNFPGLEAVGWYRSYTRSEAAVTASDLAVLDRHFPEPGRVLLLLKPTSPYGVSGFFFVRGEQGTLNLEPVGDALVLRPKLDFSSNRPLTAPELQAPVATSTAESSPLFTAILPAEREVPSKKRRPFLIALASAALVCIAIAATVSWLRIEPPAARKLEVPPIAVEPASKPSVTPEQERNVELEKQIADLTARNRRLEQTLTILRNKPQLQKAKPKIHKKNRARK